MAHHVEPMDVDDIESDFDNKENTYHHSNVLPRTPCTEKGYEELDVSELNMKLRYSITPAASPMSKSMSHCFDNRYNASTDESLNNTVTNENENNLARSLHSALNKTDSKSSKVLPLQSSPADLTVDSTRNATILQPLVTTIDNNTTVTVSNGNEIDDVLLFPSCSSSMTHTPEATTPTKENLKDGGSPIMRGLKSVLSMFRSSQSPIPPGEAENKAIDAVLSPTDVLIPDSKPQAMASTPINQRNRGSSLSRRNSPHKETIVFNEDLEKELQWNDDSTIVFSTEKIPIHKLFLQDKPASSKTNYLQQPVNEDVNSSVEYMDVSYNDASMRERTMNTTGNKSTVIDVPESDGEFVDCETTIMQDECQVTTEEDSNLPKFNIQQQNNTAKVLPDHNAVVSEIPFLDSTVDIIKLIDGSQIDVNADQTVKQLDFSTTDIVNQLSDLINASEKVETNVSLDKRNVNLNDTEAPKTIDLLEQTLTKVQPSLLENLVIRCENPEFPEKICSVKDAENVSIENNKIVNVIEKLPNIVTDTLDTTMPLGKIGSNIESDLPVISSAPVEVISITTHDVTSHTTENTDNDRLQTIEKTSDGMLTHPSPCDIPLLKEGDFNELADNLDEENMHAEEILTESLPIAEAQNSLLAALNKTTELTPEIKLENDQTENENSNISCQLSLLPSDVPLPDMDDNHSIKINSLSHKAITVVPDPVQPQLALANDIGTVVDNTDSMNNIETASPCENASEEKIARSILPEVSIEINTVERNEEEKMEVSYCEQLVEELPQNLAMYVSATPVSSGQLGETLKIADSPKQLVPLCIENLPSDIELPKANTQEINIVSEEDIVITKKQIESELSEPMPAIITENNAFKEMSEIVPVIANSEFLENVAASSNPNVLDAITSSVFEKREVPETSLDPNITNTKLPDVQIDEIQINISSEISNVNATHTAEVIKSVNPTDNVSVSDVSSLPATPLVENTTEDKIDASTTHDVKMTETPNDVPIKKDSDTTEIIKNVENTAEDKTDASTTHDVKITETTNDVPIKTDSDTTEIIKNVENTAEVKTNASTTHDVKITETPNDKKDLNTTEIVKNLLQPSEQQDEEIVVSENSSPFVSISAEEEIDVQEKKENLENAINPNSIKSPSPPLSPKIVSKGYNLNFDDLDAMNPFATKTKIRMSPPPGASPNTSLETLDHKKIETSEAFDKRKNDNRRKSMPEKRKPLKPKRNFNSMFDSTEGDTSKLVKSKNEKDTDPPKKVSGIKQNDSQNSYKAQTDIETPMAAEVIPEAGNLDETYKVADNVVESHTNTTFPAEALEHNPDNTTKIIEDVITESCKSPVKSENTSSSEQSAYFSAATSSTECTESKNVFNLPEIDDKDFNPFATKSKIRQTPSPELDMVNPFATKSKIKSSPETSFVIASNDFNSTVTVDTENEFKKANYNLSICSGSSRTSDEKDVTVQEVLTEDEDTIEGPFLEAEDNDEAYKIPEINSDKVDIDFNNINAQAIEDDTEAAEMFIDAEAFEFLMNQNNTDEVAYSGKESLFLKFDPLFARRVTSEGVAAAFSEIKKRQSTPKKISKPIPPKDEELMSFDKLDAGPSDLNNTQAIQLDVEDIHDDMNVTVLSKPVMAVTPAVNPVVTPKKPMTPTRANRLSMTFTSPAMAVIDRLLSLSGNSPSAGLDTTVTHASRERTEADQALTQLRELLAEKEINVYNLRCESKELKNRLSALEAQMKSLEAVSAERLQKVNELTENLAEKTKTNRSMAAVVEEYERTIASLISETEQDKKRYAEERMQLIRDRDEQTAHLTSMEVSFSDLHSKYEKSKQVIIGYKTNEEAYKNSIKEFEDNLAKMHSNYELLKQHATSKLNHANQELEKLNKAHEAEILKYNAMIKRKDLHITSLEESLAQKTKANEELTAICDELINKVG